MSERNFEKDLVIDENALDVEWLEQPRLFMIYAKEAIKARTALDYIKEALEVVKAKLDRDIRKDPDKFGITKITESVVTNTILLQREYQGLNEKLIEVKYEAELCAKAVHAMDLRKSALENLVKLHGQQYFAGPSVPRDLSREAQKRKGKKTSNEKIKEKMKRTKE